MNNTYFPIKVLKATPSMTQMMVLEARTTTVHLLKNDEIKSIRSKMLLNLSSFKYGENEGSLKDAKGPSNYIVVYEDVKNKLYGLVKVISSRDIRIWWIPKDKLEKNKHILNYSNLDNLVKIPEGFKYRYNSQIEGVNLVINPKAFTIVGTHLVTLSEFEREVFGKEITPIKKASKIGKAGTELKLNKKEKTEEQSEKQVETPVEMPVQVPVKREEHVETPVKACVEVEKTEPIKEDTLNIKPVDTQVNTSEHKEPEQTQDKPKQEQKVEPNTSLENIIKDLVNRELKLKEKEVQLEDKEALLNARENELNEREYSLIREEQALGGYELFEAETLVSGITSQDLTKPGRVNTEVKYLYETLLKMANYGDRLTVPFEVYKQFTVIIRSKALERNSSYTVFTQISQIKIDSSQTASLLAMVEVDNENPVKLTILSEYGLQKIDSLKIQKFESDYRQWRRDRSYLY